MRIRTKVLLTLLAISVVPLLLLRLAGQEAMRSLGMDLAFNISSTLLDNAEGDLTRMVEDHARVLHSERQLMEAMLRTRSAEVESLMASPENPMNASLDSEKPAVLPRGLDETYCARDDSGDCISLNPDFDALTLFPSGREAADGKVADIPLQQILPYMRNLSAAMNGAVFWQTIQPNDGPTMVYPAIRSLPRFVRFRSLMPIAPHTCEAGTPVWSEPTPDPVTGTLLMTISRCYNDLRTGKPAGVVSLSLPLHAILRQNKNVRALSGHTVSMIVRAEKGTGRLRIIAREQSASDGDLDLDDLKRLARSARMGDRMDMRPEGSRSLMGGALGRGMGGHRAWHWSSVPKELYVENEDPDGYLSLVMDVEKGRSGVTAMSYEGDESFWAYAPLTPSHGTALLLIVPKGDVTTQADDAKNYVESRVQRQIRLTGLSLSGVLAAVLILAFVLTRSLTRRVQALSEVATRVAAGDFTARAGLDGKDEMADLGRTFDAMIPKLEERLKLKQAVTLAQEIQQHLLPQTPPKLPGLDLAGAALFCDETGGDFYDYVRFAQSLTRIGIVVGDVSGHGVPAALLMASARAAMRSYLFAPGRAAKAVSTVNSLVSGDTQATGQFLTLFYLELDTASCQATWVRAGHDPAMLYDPATGRVEELVGEGTALGLDDEAVYTASERSLAPGQVMLLATDGVWETRSPGGEMYGKERVRELLAQNAGRTAAEIIGAVLTDLGRFRDGLPQEDDVTLVVLKLLDECGD